MLKFIDELKKNNELLIINEYVSTELEITEITERIFKSGINKALLFNKNETKIPVATNLFGNEKRISIALNVNNLQELEEKISSFISFLLSKSFSFKKIYNLVKVFRNLKIKKVKGKGICQEVIYNIPDLNNLPILKCWPFDAGKFITLPIVHTLNPDGSINIGMYRLQVLSKDKLIIHWHIHKDGASNYFYYLKKKKLKKVPIAVTLGGNPVYTYCAIAPFPKNFSEYLLASFLLKKPIKFVKCISQDIYVPYDSDIVIEGYIDLEEELALEGPFGDHTGFYSLPDFYPIMHVTTITRKKNPIYPATIVGIPPQEDMYFSVATKYIFSPIIKFLQPEIKDIFFPFWGIVHNLIIVKIDSIYPAQAFKIVSFIWSLGQLALTKIVIIVNHSFFNEKELFYCLFNNLKLSNRLFKFYGPLDTLDISSAKKNEGGKLLFDATNFKKEIIFNCEEYEFLNFITNYQNLKIEAYYKELGTIILKTDSLLFDNQKFVNEIKNIKINNEELRVFFIEEKLCPNNMEIYAWHFLANFDPYFDYIKIETINKKNILIFNGLIKKRQDKIPAPTIMTNNIINLVDNKWNNYFKDMPFVSSFSLKMRNFETNSYLY